VGEIANAQVSGVSAAVKPYNNASEAADGRFNVRDIIHYQVAKHRSCVVWVPSAHVDGVIYVDHIAVGNESATVVAETGLYDFDSCTV
jgi:hypothetical protein